MIPHGVFTHLADAPRRRAAPAELAAVERARSCCCFGLMRPYKGIDVLLEAWRGIEGAELWVVGMPRMDIAPLRAAAPPGVRFVPRFVGDARAAGVLPARATSSCCPTARSTSPASLFTALAFGTPLLLSDVGGFPEIAATGAAELVPPGDAAALRAHAAPPARRPAARDGARRAARERRARALRLGAIARAHLDLYERLAR